MRTRAYKTARLRLSACASIQARIIHALVNERLTSHAREAASAATLPRIHARLHTRGPIETRTRVAHIDHNLAVHALIAGQTRALKTERIQLGAQAAILARIRVALVNAQLALHARASLRTRASIPVRPYSQTLAGHTRRATTVVCLDLAMQAVVAGRAEALVAVDLVEAAAAVQTRLTQTLVYVILADLAVESQLTLTHVAQRVGAFQTRAPVLTQTHRARANPKAAAFARVQASACALVDAHRGLRADASVQAWLGRALIYDQLTVGARHSVRTLASERAILGHTSALVTARCRQTRVNELLTVGACDSWRAHAHVLIGIQALTRSVDAGLGRTRVELIRAVGAKVAGRAITRVGVD